MSRFNPTHAKMIFPETMISCVLLLSDLIVYVAQQPIMLASHCHIITPDEIILAAIIFE